MKSRPAERRAHALEQPVACRRRGRRTAIDVRAVSSSSSTVAIAARPEANAKPCAAALESATQRSKAKRVGLCAARVLEALVHARALLGVGRGGVDRRHHRAGGRVGRLAGVDGAGGEVESVLALVIALCAAAGS